MIDYIKDDKTRDIQKLGLEILCEFHEICKTHNLKYILDYGTLLGAIRHKGFIPWDDDIDVAMPREDFEKFKKIAKTALPEKFFLQTHDTDRNYYLTLAKIRIPNNQYIEKAMEHLDIIHGPWVDIFVYDYKYDKKELELEKQNSFNRLRNIYPFIIPSLGQEKESNEIKEKIKDIVKSVLKRSQIKENRGLIMKYLDYRYKKIENLLKSSPKENKSGEMMTYTFSIDLGNPEKSQTLNIDHFKQRKLQEFEKHSFYIPINYEQILIDRYGDYKKLPPFKERKSNHDWVD